ncbi:MAG: hypothetical protein ABW179_03510 [Methylobacterium sp.]
MKTIERPDDTPHANGRSSRHPVIGMDVRGVTSLSVDERTALCLLSMARDLLKHDHPAVAAMIDYAMLDVAIGQPD